MSHSYASAYGFDDADDLRGGGGAAGAVVSWTPSSDAPPLAEGRVTSVSAPNRSGAAGGNDGKGWFSCRVMIVGKPKTKLCAPNKSGQSSTMVIAQGVLIDHPGDRDGVRINNPEFVRLADNNSSLVVHLGQKGADPRTGGNSTVRLIETTKLKRGTIFEFTFFGKDKLREPSNQEAPCDYGDVLRLSGVTHILSPGDKVDPKTGRRRFFKKFDVVSAEHKGQLSQMPPLQSHLYSTVLNWLPATQPPAFVRMSIPEDVDYHALAEEARKRKAERDAKRGGADPAKPAASASPAAPDAASAAKPAATTTTAAAKRQLVLPTEEDGYHVDSVIASFEDERAAGNLALTDESRQFTYENPYIFVPVHVADPRVVRFQRLAHQPITAYLCQPDGAMRIDPTNRELFCRDKKPEKDSPEEAVLKAALKAGKEPPPAEKEPHFRFGKQVRQRIAPDAPMRSILFDVGVSSETLRQYGICDPLAQIEVLPYLIAGTPAVVRTWINAPLSARRSTDPDPDSFTYVLSAANKFMYTMSGQDHKLPQVGLFADLACGIVSAGYRVSQQAACDLLDLLGKRPEYAEPTADGKIQRQVQADMSAPRLKNSYSKGKPEQINPLNLVQDAPILNCCESNFNWKAYGADYHFYVVANYAEKNFDKYPELRARTESFGAAAEERQSKIFVELAKPGGKLADAADAALFGPPRATDYRPTADGRVRPMPVPPAADAKDPPLYYVVFAVLKEYAAQRGLDHYFGDDAFHDVVCKSESYLDHWSAQIASRPPPPPAAKRKERDESPAEAPEAKKQAAVAPAVLGACGNPPAPTARFATRDSDSSGGGGGGGGGGDVEDIEDIPDL